MAPNQVLSDEEKLMFIRDGYIVLRGALSEDMVQRALKIVDEAYEDGKYEFDPEKFDAVPRFHDEVSRHPDIIELPERTVIHKAAEDLLGKGKARINRTAQVAFRLKDQSMIDKGMSMTDLIPQFRYHIDGGTGVLGPTGTPFTMLVGICLSSGQDIQENRGQFTAWPGSHFKLHRVVRQRWQDGLIKGHQIFGGHGPHKPKIGKPVRMLLNPGDALLAHQRLGHAGGINLHNDIRKNLYFRVSHINHRDIVEEVLEGSVFTEYEGVKDDFSDEIARLEAEDEAKDEEN